MKKSILFVLFFLLLFSIPNTLTAQLRVGEVDYSREIIRDSYLNKLGPLELFLLNEDIYARRGLIFKEDKFKTYYSNQSKYSPSIKNINDIILNSLEEENINKINRRLEIVDNIIISEKNSNYKKLTKAEIDYIFTEKYKRTLNISFNIVAVYPYFDITGNYYLLLMENIHEQPKGKEHSRKIRMLNSVRDGQYALTGYELNDMIDKDNDDTDIKFLPEYIYMEDFDKDNIIEPIIVYATSTNGDYSMGIVKIFVYKNKRSSAIRITNDKGGKNNMIQIDRSFYDLAPIIQEKVIEQMKRLDTDKISKFPMGWEQAMRKQESLIW